MPRPALTRQLAYAAATDAGNRSARKAGRKVWSDVDYDAAAVEFERLWPISTAVETSDTPAPSAA